jgi:hypothetical protein
LSAANDVATRTGIPTEPALRLIGTQDSLPEVSAFCFCVDPSGAEREPGLSSCLPVRFCASHGQAPVLGRHPCGSGLTLWRWGPATPGAGGAAACGDEATPGYRDGGGQRQLQELAIVHELMALQGRYPAFGAASRNRYSTSLLPVRIRHSRIPYSTQPFVVNDAGLISLETNRTHAVGHLFADDFAVGLAAVANAPPPRMIGLRLTSLHVAALVRRAQAVITGLAVSVSELPWI